MNFVSFIFKQGQREARGHFEVQSRDICHSYLPDVTVIPPLESNRGYTVVGVN
jgi:hypothetical protein